jgi:cell division protein FtsB
MKAVDYARMAPLLVGAVQAQEQKIQALEQEIEALKAEVESLRTGR